jgi:hypothetical protein
MEALDTIMQAGSGFATMIFWLIIIAALVLLGWFVISKGLLAQRKYIVILDRRRGGGVKREVFKGRFIKNSDKGEEFEIATSFMGRLFVSPPPEMVIAEGDIVEGVNQGENEVRWCRPGINESGEADLKPILPEGARTAWGVVFKSNFERKHQANKWQQLLPPALLFLGCIAVAFAIWMGYDSVAKSNGALAASNQAFAERLLNNASVIIQKQAPSSSYIVQPPSNTPPG